MTDAEVRYPKGSCFLYNTSLGPGHQTVQNPLFCDPSCKLINSYCISQYDVYYFAITESSGNLYARQYR